MRLKRERAQATLEYAYLIGIVAAAIIAMLAYISRGFQGNLRSLSEQAGSGSYDPRNTTVSNTETKHTLATVKSSSTVTYNAAGGLTTTSNNIETGTETIDRQTNEALGNLSNDSWH